MRCRKLWRKAHDQSVGAFVNCSIPGIPGISDHSGIYLHDQLLIRNQSCLDFCSRELAATVLFSSVNDEIIITIQSEYYNSSEFQSRYPDMGFQKFQGKN